MAEQAPVLPEGTASELPSTRCPTLMARVAEPVSRSRRFARVLDDRQSRLGMRTAPLGAPTRPRDGYGVPVRFGGAMPRTWVRIST
jgi:hypothetical protein